MALKKNRFIDRNLAWCEKTLTEWEKDVSNNPFDKLEDRWGMKTTQKGGVTHVIVASIEQQKESHRKTMKDIFELLPRVNELRAEEDSKKNRDGEKGRGDTEMPDIMKD